MDISKEKDVYTIETRPKRTGIGQIAWLETITDARKRAPGAPEVAPGATEVAPEVTPGATEVAPGAPEVAPAPKKTMRGVIEVLEAS